MHITCLMVLQPASGMQVDGYVQQERAFCQPRALRHKFPGFFEPQHCLLPRSQVSRLFLLMKADQHGMDKASQTMRRLHRCHASLWHIDFRSAG